MNQGTLTSATIKLDEEILSHFEINFVTVVVVDVDADVDVDVFVDTYCHLRDQSQIAIIHSIFPCCVPSYFSLVFVIFGINLKSTTRFNDEVSWAFRIFDIDNSGSIAVEEINDSVQVSISMIMLMLMMSFMTK